MQIAVIEFARNVLGFKDAHSGEFDEQCEQKVIDFMPGQSEEIDKGGTLLCIMELYILSNQTDMYFLGTISDPFHHLFPICQLRFRRINVKLSAYNIHWRSEGGTVYLSM